MKINKIECIPVSLKLAKPILVSRGTLSTSECIVLKIHTDEGITGISDSGGISPRYIGETQDSVVGIINKTFAPILLGEDPFNIDKIVNRMDVARHNYQAKATVDYALHDIVGKKLGVPVYKILGGLSVEKIPLAFVISSETPEGIAEEAVKLVKAGFKTLKVKTGHWTGNHDVENIKAVRQAVGDDIEITIDTNGAWNYYQALRILKKLEKYDIAIAEQPVPWQDIDGLARLRKKVGIPIFADESATELEDLTEIIAKEAADGLCFKVGRVGGILKARKWMAVAKAAGLPVMCGCMIASGIEAAAQAHLLAADEWSCKVAQGNIGPLHVHDLTDTITTPITTDLAKNVPRYENGFMYTPDGPGLGVELNEAIIPGIMTPGKKATVISL